MCSLQLFNFYVRKPLRFSITLRCSALRKVFQSTTTPFVSVPLSQRTLSMMPFTYGRIAIDLYKMENHKPSIGMPPLLLTWPAHVTLASLQDLPVTSVSRIYLENKRAVRVWKTSMLPPNMNSIPVSLKQPPKAHSPHLVPCGTA